MDLRRPGSPFFRVASQPVCLTGCEPHVNRESRWLQASGVPIRVHHRPLIWARIERLVPTGLWVWLPAVAVSFHNFLWAWFNAWEYDWAFSMFFRSVGGHEGAIRTIGTDPTLSLTGDSLGLYLAVPAAEAAKSKIRNLDGKRTPLPAPFPPHARPPRVTMPF
jgi:hypothetical protein